MAIQPLQADETFQELTFPVSGIDSSQEFDRQPPQTGRDGLNVRAFESLTQRGRGGSRPGLVEYIPMLIPGGGPIQNLNFVVLVDDNALLIEDGISGQGDDVIPKGPGGFGGPGGNLGPGGVPGGQTGTFLGPTAVGPQGGIPDSGEFITDPSTSNIRRRQPVVHRVVRKKGSGIRPTRNTKSKMNTPVAVDDGISVQIGGDSSSVRPTDNDAFLGQPFVQLEAPEPADLLGGSLEKSGNGINFTVTYTPPASGPGGVIVIPYSLIATGNSSAAFAKIVITVEPESNPPYPPDPPPKTYTIPAGAFEYGDGFETLTVTTPGNPFENMTIQFIADPIFAGSFDVVVLFDGNLPNPPFPPFPGGALTGPVLLTLLSNFGDPNQWNGTVG